MSKINGPLHIDKAQTLLDYQPKYMIEKGMDETMDWYIKDVNKIEKKDGESNWK